MTEFQNEQLNTEQDDKVHGSSYRTQIVLPMTSIFISELCVAAPPFRYSPETGSLYVPQLSRKLSVNVKNLTSLQETHEADRQSPS